MKKKIIGIISAVCSVAFVASLTAYAYFTHIPIGKTNTVIIGENDIALQETFPEVKSQEQENINQKSVMVENTSNIECFVRVYLAFSDSSVADVSSFAVGETKPTQNAGGWKSVKSYVSGLPTGWAYQTFDGTTWETPGEISVNGWYYYTSALGKGEKTSDLIDWVKTNYADERDIQDFDIFVYTESVQSVLDSGEKTANYQKAWAEYLYPNGGA